MNFRSDERKTRGRVGTAFTAGTVAGAVLQSLLDPERGKRRRAMMRDKSIHAAKVAQRGFSRAGRDLSHRVRGPFAAVRSRLSDRELPGDVRVARVRAKLGRMVSHPHAIDVKIERDRLVLEGDVLRREAVGLLPKLRRIPGVGKIEDRLTVHEHADAIPSLQGGVTRPGRRPEFLQENWTPAIRVIAGGAGMGMVMLGAGLRGIGRVGLSAAGALLAARAVTNYDVRRLLGLKGRQGIDIQKSIYIQAPPDFVYRFWRSFENFPRFMNNVSEVEDLGDGKSRWCIAGPAGVPIEWTAEITRDEPGRILAWKSVPGQVIRHAGIVRFQPEKDGTRVHIRMTYSPPAGVIGHAVATFFRSDPKHEMTEDLVRMKSLIEQSKTTAHGQTVSRDEIPLIGEDIDLEP